MNNSFFVVLRDLWKPHPRLSPEEKAIDTLTAFVHDAEHELLSVATALQAHVDLLEDEQGRKITNVDRFAIINRTIARLISDISVLGSIAELAKAPRSHQKQLLERLMQEIAQETQAEFNDRQVSLSCDIAPDTTLIGNAGTLKLMITGMLRAVLHKCHKLETVRIIGLTSKRLVSLSFCTDLEPGTGVFKSWQLGALRLIPLNGDGIGLSAVDAMARLQHGQLSVSNLSDQKQSYRLTFGV